MLVVAVVGIQQFKLLKYNKKKKKNKIISHKIVWFKISGGKWGILKNIKNKKYYIYIWKGL